VDRVKGTDQAALEALAVSFGEAEAEMRTVALGTDGASKVAEAMLNDPLVAPRAIKPVTARTAGALAALLDPPAVQAALGVASLWWISQTAEMIARFFSRWFRHTGPDSVE